MKRSRFTVTQIVGILKEADGGVTVREFCCEDEADLDRSGVIDIGDLTILINRLFTPVMPPPPCP